jgi:hypothetical protein
MNDRDSGSNVGIILLVIILLLALPCIAGVGIVAYYKMFVLPPPMAN